MGSTPGSPGHELRPLGHPSPGAYSAGVSSTPSPACPRGEDVQILSDENALDSTSSAQLDLHRDVPTSDSFFQKILFDGTGVDAGVTLILSQQYPLELPTLQGS
ncbi:hypothetical protein ASPWEDRAFT_176818 [Aspergillus wentii DTO 134E9]|uniref:Uncharacterized protein n=1 Tax=Aspergillus wentii DTO 134E9 TaxID=1073089 RepID=A0A1L9R5J7_ASPWE|nr:uncharacterized protein ASPWEDRAFT_176818 [Aspergillus wentii DTO 134E9]KAI9925356.1 hypothetical protein MW887_006284 [Aspergillus wentii]OJJ30148.1 hypothetical protein ASPWEDRAFT_176818 [Aspergillus wentii DTO 134E9]